MADIGDLIGAPSAAAVDDSDVRQKWQDDLEKEFASRIDPSLIAALAHEQGQSYSQIHATLKGIAADGHDDIQQHDFAHDADEHAAISSSPAISRDPSSPAIVVDEASVQRALEEWKLIDDESEDPDNLRMTDEEDAELQDVLQSGQLSPPHQMLEMGEDSVAATTDIDFMLHAFPTRTPAFLQSMLNDEHGDVSRTVDALMTLELIESGAFDEVTQPGERSDQKGSVTARSAVKMADDDDHLAHGTGVKKTTKRERQRRKAQQAQANALGKMNSSAVQRVYLNDVRQGGQPHASTGSFRQKMLEQQASAKGVAAEGEDDAALAARLAREERIAAGLPADELDEDDDAAVMDNDWLFSSSVLEQIGLLLSLPSHKVRSVHAACHMNLRATVQRLVYVQSQEHGSLEALDEASEQPAGSHRALLDGLCVLMPSKARSEVERYLRASGGRQDDVLDLAQLADRVESAAAGERTDVLDPMKAERAASSQAYAPTMTTHAGQGAGHFAWVGDTAPAATPFAVAASRTKSKKATDPSSRAFALERLRNGAASVTFPLNSAHAIGASGFASGSQTSGGQGETAAQAARLAHEYTAISQEYRARRQDYLAKAAQSYRSNHSARGPVRGAAAWVYADEARRLEAKSRAFAMQAAQATVRYRMLVNRSGGALPGANTPGDVVDLHGLTVHESLSVTRQALEVWWSRQSSSSGRPTPLHVVTGVGRHSRAHVALVRPAVLAMLQRERWINREPQDGHILVLGRK